MTPIPFDPVDAAWYQADRPYNRMFIRGMFRVAGRLDPDLLVKEVDERLRPFGRFHWLVEDRGGLRRPRWVEMPGFEAADNFTFHGRVDDARRLIDELAVTDLPTDRPLWHAHVIENADATTDIFFVIHHSIGDGQALVHVLLSLCDPVVADPSMSRERRRDERLRPAAKTPDPGPVARWAKLLSSPFRKLAVFLRLAVLRPDTKTVLRGPVGEQKQLGWTAPVAVADVRAAGERLGATINDVLLSAMAGGIGAYLKHRGTPVGRRGFRVMVPVDVRPKDEVPGMGNRFGLVVLTMPAGERDPTARTAMVVERMDAIKIRPEAGVGFGVVKLLGFVPKALEALVVRFFAAKTSAVITNVIGPRSMRQIARQPISDVLVWVPQSGRLGLGIAIFSYDGHVRITLMADASRVPDIGVLVDCLDAELLAVLGT